jgi:hypothetical protein
MQNEIYDFFLNIYKYKHYYYGIILLLIAIIKCLLIIIHLKLHNFN